MTDSAAGSAAMPPRGVAARLVVFALALLALVLLFGGSAARIAERWTEPEYSHGFLIPILTCFVLWRRRHRIAERADGGAWIGVAMVAAGAGLGILGSVALSDIPQVLGLIVVLGGLGLAAFGLDAMRLAWAPLAFLLFAVPVPAPLHVALSIDLQLLSSELGARMLDLVGVPVFLDGNIIDLGVMKLQVAEACSGLRYLFPLLSFGVIAAWLFRAPMWARVLLVLSTIPITIAINSLRIALTGIIVEYATPELGEGFLHLFEGWVIFLFALALFVAVTWLLARLSRRNGTVQELLDFDRLDGGERPTHRPSPSPATMPVPAAIAIAIILIAHPLEIGLAERTEAVPDRPGLVTFPLRFDDWSGQPLPVEPEVLDVLGADDYFLADYAGAAADAPVNLWIAYYESQLQEDWIHSPKECLPGGGWEFVWIDEMPAPVDAAGNPFTINRSLIARGREQMVMYHWYEQRGKRYTDEVWARINLLRDAFVLQRSDGALIRLLTPLRSGEEVADAEGRLTGLLRAVLPHLDPHVGL
jgi:exosortase D (VPLPA-CTERM-specific)